MIRAIFIAAVAGATAPLLAGCGLAGGSAPGKAEFASTAPRTPWEQPVRKAICGPLDKVETALQGQVPLADRASGRSQEGYNCNLELVGQWQGDGAAWQHAWFEDCAYYGTRADSSRANQGVVIVDGSKPGNPHPTGYLTTTPMIDPWESLKVNEQRKLLGAVDGLNSGGGAFFDVYDLSGGCREPKLLFSGPMGETIGHEGNWAQNGKTYWGASTSLYSAFDVDDPNQPEYMLSWAPEPVNNAANTHGLSTNAEGTRGYFVHAGLGGETLGNRNGLVIADLTEVEQRKPGAEVKMIGSLYWNDGSETAQHTIPIFIGGKPYVVFVDEAGVSGKNCGSGLSPYAFARIIDISDERHPALVSKLMLETHDPANCALVVGEYAGQVLFGYDSHYCSVDDPLETTAIACGYFSSGIRVFDVRDPYFPREIAYYNPPAQIGKASQLKGSQHANFLLVGSEPKDAGMTADWCTAQVRFVKNADGGGELWTTCHDNGFMVLKFTNGVWPFRD